MVLLIYALVTFYLTFPDSCTLHATETPGIISPQKYAILISALSIGYYDCTTQVSMNRAIGKFPEPFYLKNFFRFMLQSRMGNSRRLRLGRTLTSWICWSRVSIRYCSDADCTDYYCPCICCCIAYLPCYSGDGLYQAKNETQYSMQPEKSE